MMNFELTVHEGMELCPGTPTIELQFIRGAQVPEILEIALTAKPYIPL
jgi:hypothetical protein